MLIIPAIDLKNNKVVRLFQGKYDKVTIYSDNPIKYAIFFENEGAKRLHVVDLDGAKEGIPVHKEIIIKLSKSINIPVQVGGGIRDEETIKFYLSQGISQVIIGTKAVESLDWLKEVTEKFPYKIIVSVDIRGEKVSFSGWQKISEVFYLDFLKNLNKIKLFAVILTLIELDGTQQGLEKKRLEKALKVSQHPIIIAGGISNLEDIKTLIKYKDKGLLGIIIGRALYEGSLNLKSALKIINES